MFDKLFSGIRKRKEKRVALRKQQEEESFHRWFDKKCPRRNTFHPRNNLLYSRNMHFARPHDPFCEGVIFEVKIHDKQEGKSFDGSFKVMGHKTGISKIRYEYLAKTEMEEPYEDKMFFVPTSRLRFTKKVWRKHDPPTDRVHYQKVISYWVFIK